MYAQIPDNKNKKTASRASRLAAAGVVAALAAHLAGCAGGATSLAPTVTTSSLGDKKFAAPAASGVTPAAENEAQVAGSPEAKRGPARVTMLLPLTAGGQTGLIAETMKKAAELAVIEQQGANIVLTVKDDKGTPEGAKAAAADAIAGGAELILGPLFAQSATAVAPIAAPAKVPVISFSSDRQVAGRGVMLLSHLADQDVRRIISYAGTTGKKRIIALIPDDAFGKIVAASLTEAAAKSGVTIIAVEHYNGVVASMIVALQKAHSAMVRAADEGAPVDAVFLPGGEDTLAVLSPLLAQAQIDTAKIKVLGTGGMDYPHAGRNPQLAGAWFPGPDPRGWQDFAERFAKAVGYSPPRIASLAYDSVGVAIALSNGADRARFTPEAIARPSGFTGVDGAVRFAANGLPERALAVLEVQSFGANVIDQPPALGNAVSAVVQPAAVATAVRAPSYAEQ